MMKITHHRPDQLEQELISEFDRVRNEYNDERMKLRDRYKTKMSQLLVAIQKSKSIKH